MKAIPFTTSTRLAYMFNLKIWCWSCLPLNDNSEGVHMLYAGVDHQCHKCLKIISASCTCQKHTYSVSYSALSAANSTANAFTYEDKDIKFIKILAKYEQGALKDNKEIISLFAQIIDNKIHTELGGRYEEIAVEYIANRMIDEHGVIFEPNIISVGD